MCMTFGYNPQINFCHYFHSLNLVIFGLNYYRSLWTLFEIKTIGGGIRVPWTLFLVVSYSLATDLSSVFLNGIFLLIIWTSILVTDKQFVNQRK